MGHAASAGPANDCVVNTIEEFEAQLRAPTRPTAERLLALKFLVHFVGDIHQPLHASDHDDRGGNCIGQSPELDRKTNLHAYWDTGVVDALGGPADTIAAQLNSMITATEVANWGRWNARAWA